ncbi:MAG: cell division ATP-binding protein FtsE, partial [Candidatus Roizmanbacteria bacterium]
MIQFDNVTKTYLAGTVGLKSISFGIEDNDFVFLVGPSGAGKTTILKLLMRQIKPTSGSVIIDGTEISSPAFHDVTTLRRSIGMVFQDFKILQDRNVFENIAIALKIMDKPHHEIVDEVSEAL